MPSVERLEQVLWYQPDTGELLWKSRRGELRWNRRYAGKLAGMLTADGYRMVCVDNVKTIPASHIAWALAYGWWPRPPVLRVDQEIDHVDGDRANNRLANLRIATKRQQARNRKVRRDSKTGLRGVSPKAGGRWVARISLDNGTRLDLGRFATKEEAAAAYAAASRLYHAEFGRVA